MLDFLSFKIQALSNRTQILVPVFKFESTKDLMTRGKDFYAIWDFENGCWSTSMDRAYALIDLAVDEYVRDHDPQLFVGVKILKATEYDSRIAEQFQKYVRLKSASFVPLDTKVVFKSDTPDRNKYSSKRLPYDPKPMKTPEYDELMSVLYSPEEQQKIEWLVGAGLCGDNGKIQKFGVFYGEPGTGKGTVLDIIAKLFDGYSAAFEADALGRSSDSFALEPFKNHPVVAIQTDGNLSRVEDNARLNSLISHEVMTVNEKFKGKYDTRFDTILFIASNEPVQITNAKSGLLRRLINIEPTGNTVPKEDYDRIKTLIPFEIPGIAYRCMKLYSENKSLYNSYKPMSMMAKTNDFYDFVLEYYDQFMAEDYILLSAAWTWYKKYVEDANSYSKMPRRAFATELSTYFESGPLDEWYLEDGVRKHLSSVYRGFKHDKFKNIKQTSVVVAENPVKKDKTLTDILSELPSWLVLKSVESVEHAEKNVLNVFFREATAQYAEPTESGRSSRPRKPWDNVNGKLGAINTLNEHYILTQSVEPKLIVIDFDLKDPETKEKSLKLNLLAAMKFPKTYAETSKSGKGLHLHYIYDGDVKELSPIYDKDIEVKVFAGKSALRRRLSLCNDEEIAHISSGLPFKEVKKKMVNWEGIEDEKHLRALIKKGLRRKVHANTRPSIDYINKVLTEAFESGMKYDVTDLRPKVMNFAAGATNQSEYCMNLVCEMPFCSEDPSENKEGPGYLEKLIAFFDWEVFPNLCILCYKVEGGTIGEEGKKEVVQLINPTPNEVRIFFDSYRAIGFNNLDYDNRISYARILGYSNEELYQLSKNIIGGKRDAGFRESKNLSYTDIYDFSNSKQGIKKWEIELDLHHQEFPYPWDQPVPEELWHEAADYCCNDVVATEVVFYSNVKGRSIQADWKARQVLSKLSGLTVNDRTNNHSCQIIFGNDRNPQTKFNYPDLSKEFPGYEYTPYKFEEERYNVGKDGKSVRTTGHSIFMGDDPSEGGYVYYDTGIWHNVALLDIASLHPSTIEVLELFGPYTKRFSEIKAARVAIKHKEWDKARGYLDGALVPFLEGVESLSEDEQQELSDDLSYAFKIVINSIYGLTSAKFPNRCKDPRNVDNVVAKRGALFMILLKWEVLNRGYTVVHVKTDSIKIAEADDKIIQFVMDFGKKYGYSFEHEATYDRICLVNKSVYIAKYDEYGERTKGGRHANAWTPTGAEFQHPYVFKKLFSHEDVNFRDMCETKTVSGGTIYLDMNEDLVSGMEEEVAQLREELAVAEKGKMDIRKKIKELTEKIEATNNFMFVGRCGSFCPVEPGCGGGLMMRLGDDGRIGAISGTKGYRWLEAETVKERGLEDRLDSGYFRGLVDSAYAHIEAYGDADEFING